MKRRFQKPPPCSIGAASDDHRHPSDVNLVTADGVEHNYCFDDWDRIRRIQGENLTRLEAHRERLGVRIGLLAKHFSRD